MQFTCQPGLLLLLESCFCAAANSRLATLVVPRCEATNNICHIWHDGNYFRVLCASRVALWKLPVSLSVRQSICLSFCLCVYSSVCHLGCLPPPPVLPFFRYDRIPGECIFFDCTRRLRNVDFWRPENRNRQIVFSKLNLNSRNVQSPPTVDCIKLPVNLFS